MLAVRTYVGTDMICQASDTERLKSALLARGAQTVSEQTAEILRVERGRPRYGIDLDDTVIPQEAGLNERAVSFTKGCYVGQETVARLYYRGKPNRHLRGLRLSEPAATGDELRLGEKPVGRLGSTVVSPALGPIALALVRREAEPGAIVSTGAEGASAEIAELPFASHIGLLAVPFSYTRGSEHVAIDLQQVSSVDVEPGELPKTMAAWVIREERFGEPKDAFQLEEIEVPSRARSR